MPNQPSKESLKLATAFFIGYFGNNAEKHHPLGIGTLAFVFDAEAKDLRQQNAALVSALQDTRTVLANYCCQNPRWLYDGKDQDPSGAHALLEKVDEILALCAPAEDEAKEKP